MYFFVDVARNYMICFIACQQFLTEFFTTIIIVVAIFINLHVINVIDINVLKILCIWYVLQFPPQALLRYKKIIIDKINFNKKGLYTLLSNYVFQQENLLRKILFDLLWKIIQYAVIFLYYASHRDRNIPQYIHLLRIVKNGSYGYYRYSLFYKLILPFVCILHYRSMKSGCIH